MHLKFVRIAALLIVPPLSLLSTGHAQATATASANVRLSAFAGLSGNLTGLETAKNADITAGIDLGVRPFHGFYPALEGRGMYPVDSGQIVSVEDLLVGVRIGRRRKDFLGYGDVLYGRALLKYANGGLPDSTGRLYYLQNTSNALSAGIGVDWDWTEHLGLKADLQIQHFDSPVVTQGTLNAKILTVGVVYRLGFRGIR